MCYWIRNPVSNKYLYEFKHNKNTDGDSTSMASATHNYPMSDFQKYVYISRYAKYIHEEDRRETWAETVTRYFDFFTDHLYENHEYKLDSKLRQELEEAVLSMEIMPSMRCMMTAGAALHRDNIAGYNCSYVAIDNPRTFSELLFVLMCGTGVGFSVERQFVNKMPSIPEELFPTDSIIVVSDSRIGWAKALNELVSFLYSGSVPKWDMSKLRPAGAILRTFGGRSSGPEPLERLFKFAVNLFKEAAGRKLSSLECHDLACMIGECVVVGGVRRSALISLSNLSDDRMRSAKSGQWWTVTPWRSLANNSAVYNDKRPPMETFMSEWKALYDSKSGERGIFSRYAAKNIIERANDFRRTHFADSTVMRIRDANHEWGCNPCSEIILRDKQFCNLTEAVIRSSDDLASLKRKVRLAAILGTFQSTLTNFRFLSKKWHDNTADERLLGVSLTGIMDNLLTSGGAGKEKLKNALTELRKEAIATNLTFAFDIGVEPSTAVTCVKPSGTVSSLVDSASGIHSRHAPYYIRTVRSDKKDPLAQLMIDQGIPYEEDKMRPDHNWVFSFPVKAPDTAAFNPSAIEQLETWLMYQKYWCDHKPSVTVSVRDEEWMEVGAWVYRHFEWMSGVSFLPHSEHTYEQAPYQEISQTQYEEWIQKVPSRVEWDKLPEYEKVDTTVASQTLACAANGCDL